LILIDCAHRGIKPYATWLQFTRVTMADVDLQTMWASANADYDEAKQKWEKALDDKDEKREQLYKAEMDKADARRTQLEKDLGKVKRTVTASDS